MISGQPESPTDTAATSRRFLIDIGPLRRYPAFRRLWLGYAIRQIGAQLTVTMVVYQVFAITHSNLDVGLIAVAQVIPGVIAAVVGGAIADAIDRRLLLLVTSVLFAVTTAVLAVNSIGNHPTLWVLYVCSSATWALNGLDTPTRTAMLIALVDRDSYTAANVLRQIISQLSQFAGPALAGVLIAVFAHNLDIVYWIDVASTVVVLVTVARLDPLPPEGGGRRANIESIVEGFAFLRSRRVILACFITDIDATLLGLPTSLYPYMAEVQFHGGPKVFGLIAASPSVGALIGAVFSGWTGRVRYQGRAVLAAVVVWGVAIAAFGLTPWLAVGVGSLALAGWANQISGTMRNTIIQTETPDQLRGRLSSMQVISVELGRLGNAEAGLVAQVSTAQISIVSGGLASSLGAVAVAVLIPGFARYQLRSRTGPLARRTAGSPEPPSQRAIGGPASPRESAEIDNEPATG